MIRRHIIEALLILIIGVGSAAVAIMLDQKRAEYQQIKPIQDRLP